MLPTRHFEQCLRHLPTTDNAVMMQFYHRMKRAHCSTWNAAYLASDDVDTKRNMSNMDSTIHYAQGMRPFHVDLMAQNNHNSAMQYQTIRTTGSDRYLRQNVDIGTIIVLYRFEEYV